MVHIIDSCPERGVVGVMFRGMGVASRSRAGYGCIGGACEGRPYMEGLVAGGAALVCGGS